MKKIHQFLLQAFRDLVRRRFSRRARCRGTGPEPGQLFTYTVVSQELTVTRTTYTLTAPSRAEARKQFWLYWCGGDLSNKVYPVPVRSVSKKVHTKASRCLDTNIMSLEEAQLLAHVISGEIADPKARADIRNIVAPFLKSVL